MLEEERLIQFRRHNNVQFQLRLVVVPDSCTELPADRIASLYRKYYSNAP